MKSQAKEVISPYIFNWGWLIPAQKSPEEYLCVIPCPSFIHSSIVDSECRTGWQFRLLSENTEEGIIIFGINYFSTYIINWKKNTN